MEDLVTPFIRRMELTSSNPNEETSCHIILLFSLAAAAQAPVPFSSLTVYTGNTDSVKLVGLLKSGSAWTNRVFYGIDLVKSRLLIADTSCMLAPYARAFNYYTISESDARFLQSITGAGLDNVFSSVGLLKKTGVSTYSSITDNSSNWNTAFSWGNHASAGYEVATNKATSLASPDNTKYPTTLAITNAGFLQANQTISFTPAAGSDVTGSASGATSLTPTLIIGARKVLYSMMPSVADGKLIGRSAGSAGDAMEITVGTGLTLSGGTLSTTGSTGEANTASNLGSTAGREGIFASKVGVDLQFKSLVAGTNISFSSTASEITITNGITNNNQLTNGAGFITQAAALSTSTTSTQDGYFGTIKLKDVTNPSHYLTIDNNEDLTANHSFHIVTGNADRTLTLSANATISGTNTGDQTITLTGPVTGSGTGSFATAITDAAVTLAKMENRATQTFIGRNTTGTGVPEELSVTTVRTMLSISNVENTALSTWAGSANIVTVGTIATGTWSATAIGATKGGTAQTTWTLGDLLYASASNTLSKLAGNTSATKMFLSQTGNATISAAPAWSTVTSTDVGLGNVENTAISTWAGSTSLTTFANNAVSYAEMQDVSATQRIIGRNTAGAGDPEEVTASQVLDWFSATQGAILYRGASGWVALAPGTAGQILQSGGAAANLSWADAGAGSGDMILAATQTVTGAKTFNAGTLIIAAGTTTAPAIDFTVGTLKTTSAQGDMEVDPNGIFMYTPKSGGTTATAERGYIPAMQYVSNTSTVTLTVQTANQAVFGSTMDQINLSTNTTYRFYAKYYGTKTSAASTGAVKVGFAFAGTLGSIAYTSKGNVGTVNGANGSSQEVYWTTLAGGNATNTTASTPNWWLEVSGEIRVGATGGLFTPQVGLSSTTGTTAWNTDINSFIEIWPVGSNTVTVVGTGQ
jgi:hypothetical protein